MSTVIVPGMYRPSAASRCPIQVAPIRARGMLFRYVLHGSHHLTVLSAAGLPAFLSGLSLSYFF